MHILYYVSYIQVTKVANELYMLPFMNFIYSPVPNCKEG